MTISSQPVDDILAKRHPSKQPRTKPHKQPPIHTRRPMQKTPSPFIQQPRIKHSADSHSTRQNAQKNQENKRIYKLSTDYLQSNAKKNVTLPPITRIVFRRQMSRPPTYGLHTRPSERKQRSRHAKPGRNANQHMCRNRQAEGWVGEYRQTAPYIMAVLYKYTLLYIIYTSQMPPQDIKRRLQ